MAASSPSWRAGVPRVLRRSSRNRSSSRLAISATGSVLVRAAASSMASGRPSRWRTRTATAGSSSPLVAISGCTALARSTNSAAASAASRGSNGTWCSPSTDSGSRLVVRIRTLGQPCSSATTSVAAASATCSQLSRITTASRSASRSIARCVAVGTGRPASAARSGAPTAAATTSATAAPSTSGASSMNRTSRSLAMRWASSRVERDLPTPPGPTTVTRRARPSVATTSVSSRARPTNDVRVTGNADCTTAAETTAIGASRAGSCASTARSSACSSGPGSRPSSSSR